MDRGDWQATVHRVAQSRTRLKWLSQQSTERFNAGRQSNWLIYCLKISPLIIIIFDPRVSTPNIHGSARNILLLYWNFVEREEICLKMRTNRYGFAFLWGVQVSEIIFHWVCSRVSLHVIILNKSFRLVVTGSCCENCFIVKELPDWLCGKSLLALKYKIWEEFLTRLKDISNSRWN